MLPNTLWLRHNIGSRQAFLLPMPVASLLDWSYTGSLFPRSMNSLYFCTMQAFVDLHHDSHDPTRYQMYLYFLIITNLRLIVTKYKVYELQKQNLSVPYVKTIMPSSFNNFIPSFTKFTCALRSRSWLV